MKNRLFPLLICVLIAGACALGLFLYRERTASSFDERLKTALSGVQDVHTYEMQDITHANVQGRSIDIEGVYSLDFDARSYASESTTTLTLPEMKPPQNKEVFTLAHRSIGDDVYVQILTNSPLLKRSIPNGPDWRHFKATAIPERFVDIAVAGPILDNLSLLSQSGAYLTPHGTPVDRTIASSTYRVYTFALSKRTAEVTAGPVKALIDLIATGTVDVWVDDTPAVRLMHITGLSYTSTTTILHVNTPLQIQAPATVK